MRSMSQFRVTLFRDLLKDARWSMEVYADNLIAVLEADYGDKLRLEQYRPRVLPLTAHVRCKCDYRALSVIRRRHVASAAR